jgi:hypothetical protein
MRTNSRCCSKELLLLVVPKTALKEHPQVAQPEAQEKKYLMNCYKLTILTDKKKLVHSNQSWQVFLYLET